MELIRPRLAAAPLAALALLMFLGCQQPMRTPYAQLAVGDYASARLDIHDNLKDNRSDRRYMLDRMRLGVLTLADGYPQSSLNVFEEVYDVLRTHGVNRDRTVASAVLHEGVRIWKGEPFEQAMAMLYYGLAQAQTGSWDNARAAADNALFYLRDFGTNQAGQRLNTHEIARRSLLYERARAQGQTHEEAQKQSDYLNHGYIAQPSNFTLAYLLHGIASQQLERHEEASDHFNRALELNPDLQNTINILKYQHYNTILVVSYGLGPQKQGYGPDNALARFVPRTRSNRAALAVQLDGQPYADVPEAYDINRMAADHMWNNLEDVRRAKSTLGTALLVGGIIATDIGLSRDNNAATIAGIAAIGTGALLKAGAHVDTRYADVIPQRFYLVPLYLPQREQPILLQVNGKPHSRLVLRGLAAPSDNQAQLRYVRLLAQPTHSTRSAPRWASAGEIHYSNPHTGTVSSPLGQLPYILGGNCVRPPTARTTASMM